MARKSPSILQEELYPPSAEPVRPELDDARLIDLDVNEESPFLRGQKRVSARRGSLPKKTAKRLLWGMAIAAALCVLGVFAALLYNYGEHSWRFRVESSDNIEIVGTQNVSKKQIMDVMGGDIGRNIFFIPLDDQKEKLEQIPWVEHASVMRFVPNRLKVEIQERTPVAFARVGARIELIDVGGTLMELPPKGKYSFPVILGMNPGEPLSTRAPRMKVYNQLVSDLDAEGVRHSQDLSEVDISDLDDVKVRVNDPAGDVLVHLGSGKYLNRYKIYVAHVQEWRQQFQKIESVDLRYDNQIIVNPDMPSPAHVAKFTPASVKAAAAAGVKPAALVTKLSAHDKSLPKPVFEVSEKKLHPDPPATAAKKPAAKTASAKAVVKVGKPASKKTTTVTKKTNTPAAQHAAAQKPGAKKAAQASSARVNTAKAGPKKISAAKPKSEATSAHAVPKPSPSIAKQQAPGATN